MNELRVVAISHKNFSLETIGKFHLADDNRFTRLAAIAAEIGMKEIMYLSTCNRVELIFTLPHYVCPGVTANILRMMPSGLDDATIKTIAAQADRYNGREAGEHLLRVASSLDSAIIGEREIITQLRKAYEDCAAAGLTGDDLRLIVRQCILTAKEVFTHTDLAKKPVSVVSLAWEELRRHQLAKNSRILLIGAGQIIRNFSKFLFENNFTHLTFANRTLENAESLSKSFGGRALPLSELNHFTEGFDVLITCTGAENSIINQHLYQTLLQGETSTKLVFDLAVPGDIDPGVVEHCDMQYYSMVQIKTWADQNLQFREKAIAECLPIIQTGLSDLEKILKERRIEKAMISIPEAIKDIRNTAIGSVFAKDLETLDDHSRDVLEKIMNYMEKKYISIPMKMAKDVLLDEVKKN